MICGQLAVTGHIFAPVLKVAISRIFRFYPTKISLFALTDILKYFPFLS
jgi:hypothetical protein